MEQPSGPRRPRVCTFAQQTPLCPADIPYAGKLSRIRTPNAGGTILVGALRTDLEVVKANTSALTEQRIELGQSSQSMREMVREMLAKK